jgi:hypothetical protein
MIILLYLFLTINLFAQDSSGVVLALINDNELTQNSNSYINNENDGIASLLEMRSNMFRVNSPNRTFNNKIIKLSTIQFKKKEPNFIDSDLFLFIVGSAVAFGTTAAYFKLESDAAYDKYLMTNDKSYLNRTDKYDLYSGIALGALEINIGYLIYKFLTD